MPYYSCPECALTVRSDAGRFTTRICPRCSVPLVGSEQRYLPDRGPAEINRRFAAERQAGPLARRALETLLWRLDPTDFQVAALLTTELIANAVEHAGMDRRDWVRLNVALTDDRVRVAVSDEGPGFVPARRTPQAPLDSHWGLHLVEELADRWGVEAEPKNTVWFELDRPLAPQGAHTDVTGPELVPG
jgi:anti-sigma regulatory factor (Ser/Thr protein kinase)